MIMIQYPWMTQELDSWNIVGMNHYYMHGQRWLYVAMTKDGYCIQSEGLADAIDDMRLIWEDLAHKTTLLPAVPAYKP